MTELHTLAEQADTMGLRLTDEQIDRFRRYLVGLTDWNRRVNLTSAGVLADAERVLFLDSLTLVPLIRRHQPAASRLVDVGSGAGIPGLAVKIAMPELHVTLVEATGRKAEFLRWVCGSLELSDIDVLAERAEVAAHREGLRETFDIATARALGPLSVVLELTLPFCRVGGMLIAPRGADVEEEAVRCAGVAETLGGRVGTVERASGLGARDRTALLTVDKVAGSPAAYPRRDGVPAKRPLA